MVADASTTRSGSSTPVCRIAVLVSGRGSNLRALVRSAAADADFGGTIAIVASDVASAGGLTIAREHQIDTIVCEPSDYPSRPAWERALIDSLEPYAVDLVVLAGFMRILSAEFLTTWPDRVINTHPSLLPAFPGAHAVRDALAYGVKLTGTTVHFANEQVDGGAVIAQRAVEVYADDDEARLHDRIRHAEHELLPWCVHKLCLRHVERHGRLVRIVNG